MQWRIRALVGGRDYCKANSIAHSPQQNRQVGSAFKPFVYTLAFTHGLAGRCHQRRPDSTGEIEGAGIGPRKFRWNLRRRSGLPAWSHPFTQHNERAGRSIRWLDAVQKVATTLVGPKCSAWARNLHRFVRDGSQRSHCRLLGLPNAGVRKQAYIIERIDNQETNHLFARRISPRQHLIRVQLG